MQQFKTLLLREWLQQRHSWLNIGFGVPLSAWGIFYLFSLKFGLAMPSIDSLLDVARFGLQMQTTLIGVIAIVGVLINTPGLPYRDQDDKSLAFWRSLPINDAKAVAAPLLMNAILLPLMTISIAAILGTVLSAPLWLSTGQSSDYLAMGLILLKILSYATLGLLWLLPLVLLLALSNSLLRRWGILLMLFLVYALNNVTMNILNQAPISEQISTSFTQIASLMLPFGGGWQQIGWLDMLRDTLSWHFLQAQIWTLGLFAALVWQRKRGVTA